MTITERVYSIVAELQNYPEGSNEYCELMKTLSMVAADASSLFSNNVLIEMERNNKHIYDAMYMQMAADDSFCIKC